MFSGNICSRGLIERDLLLDLADLPADFEEPLETGSVSFATVKLVNYGFLRIDCP